MTDPYDAGSRGNAGKLVRDLSTKKNREFWDGVKRAAKRAEKYPGEHVTRIAALEAENAELRAKCAERTLDLKLMARNAQHYQKERDEAKRLAASLQAMGGGGA